MRLALLLAVAAVLALPATMLGHEARVTGHTDCDGGWAKATAIDITPDRMVVVTSTIFPTTESPAGTTGYSGTVVVWEQAGTYPFEGQVTMAIYRPGRHGDWVLESHDKLTLEAPQCPTPTPTSTSTPTPTVPSTPTPTPTSRTIPSPTPTATPSASPTSSPTPTATSSSTVSPTSSASSPKPTPPPTDSADGSDIGVDLLYFVVGFMASFLVVTVVIEMGRRR